MTRIYLNTLYVGTQGAYLRLENDQVIVEAPREPGADKPPPLMRTPLHHLGSIVLFGLVSASMPLLARCAQDGRNFVLMTEQSRFQARVVGATSGNVLLRKAQHDCLSDERFATDLCRTLVAGKIQNSRQVLLRAGREAKSHEEQATFGEAAENLASILESLPRMRFANEIRGAEGLAAQAYFSVFDAMIVAQRTEFRFDRRSRRPPRDRVNALLSFIYALFTNDCVAALEGVGLDPQVGFLHVLRPGRPSLALDLIEEYRSVFLDRLCLTLINRRQVTADSFLPREGGSVSLTDDGRREVLVAFQRRKQMEVDHRLFKEKVPIGLLPHIQARLLARHLRGDVAHYIPYMP